MMYQDSYDVPVKANGREHTFARCPASKAVGFKRRRREILKAQRKLWRGTATEAALAAVNEKLDDDAQVTALELDEDQIEELEDICTPTEAEISKWSQFLFEWWTKTDGKDQRYENADELERDLSPGEIRDLWLEYLSAMFMTSAEKKLLEKLSELST
jgi:hypothetical protein